MSQPNLTHLFNAIDLLTIRVRTANSMACGINPQYLTDEGKAYVKVHCEQAEFNVRSSLKAISVLVDEALGKNEKPEPIYFKPTSVRLEILFHLSRFGPLSKEELRYRIKTCPDYAPAKFDSELIFLEDCNYITNNLGKYLLKEQ